MDSNNTKLSEYGGITNINIHSHNTRRQHEIHVVGIKHSFAKPSLI